MKFSYLFIAVFLRTSGAFQVEKLNGTKGSIRQIEFDSHSNTYLFSYGGGYDYYDQFIKLNDKNEKVLVEDIGDIWNILVTKKDDVYIFGVKTRFDDVNSAWRLKSNSNILEVLFSSPRETYYPNRINSFIDSQDNIYFNSKSGVNFLRTDQNIPLVIRNLVGVQFNSSIEDENGNVYLQIPGNSIAVITKEAKGSPVPYATILPNAGKSMTDFVNWQNVTFFIEKSNQTASITKLSGEKKDVLLSQYDAEYFFFGSTDERLFIVENNTFTDISHLYYITPLLKVVKVEGNLNNTVLEKGGKYTFDQDGTAYIGYRYDKENQILSLRFHDNKFKKVKIPGDYKNEIYDLEVDNNGDLWIMADQLYLLPKGSDVPVKMFRFETSTTEHFSIKVKKDTGELFLGTVTGLYIATNN